MYVCVPVSIDYTYTNTVEKRKILMWGRRGRVPPLFVVWTLDCSAGQKKIKKIEAVGLKGHYSNLKSYYAFVVS